MRVPQHTITDQVVMTRVHYHAYGNVSCDHVCPKMEVYCKYVFCQTRNDAVMQLCVSLKI